MAASAVSSSNGPIYFFRDFEEPYGFLSQWYPCSFTAPAPSPGRNSPDMTFFSTEQYMMYHKALAFNDHEIAQQIMLEPGPKKEKDLGGKVKRFDHKKWD